MRPNYSVVVLLPSRQIKRVATLRACNYDCCVSFTGEKNGPIDLKNNITLDKLIRKNGWSDLFDYKIKIRADIQYTGT